MAETPCESCGELTEGRYLGRIHGKRLCKKCRISIRLNHRKETRNQATEEERKKILELNRKVNAERNKKYYEPRKEKNESEEPPKIKGSINQNKEKSQAYLSFDEKKVLLGILVKKGVSFEDAKERLKRLTKSLKELREKLKEKNISEEKIKSKQQELLEELWN